MNNNKEAEAIAQCISKALAELGYDTTAIIQVHWQEELALGVAQISLSLHRPKQDDAS